MLETENATPYFLNLHNGEVAHIRAELQRTGTVSKQEHHQTVLTPRSDMTGADRGWAARYQPGDILFYSRGSTEHSVERGSYAPAHRRWRKELP